MTIKNNLVQFVLACLSGTARALYLLQFPILARKGNYRRYGAPAVIGGTAPPPYHSGKESYLRPGEMYQLNCYLAYFIHRGILFS